MSSQQLMVRSVRICDLTTGLARSRLGEANMASKDKGGRNSKTPAAKSAKEKRQSKKDKKGKKSGGLGT